MLEFELSEPLRSAWTWWREEARERGHTTAERAFHLAVRSALLHARAKLRRTDGRAPEDEADRSDSPRAMAVQFTPNQRQTVERAVARLRAECDDLTITAGRALELIAADWLS